MSKTAMIRTRAEPDLEAAGEHVLTELDITPTQATTLLSRGIVRERGIPFPLRLRQPAAEQPNA